MYEKCSILKDVPTTTSGSTVAVDPLVKPSLVEDLNDAKRFLAAGHPYTAVEWLIAEVERLTAENMEIRQDRQIILASEMRMRRALMSVTDCQGVSCCDQSENVYQEARKALAEAVRP